MAKEERPTYVEPRFGAGATAWSIEQPIFSRPRFRIFFEDHAHDVEIRRPKVYAKKNAGLAASRVVVDGCLFGLADLGTGDMPEAMLLDILEQRFVIPSGAGDVARRFLLLDHDARCGNPLVLALIGVVEAAIVLRDRTVPEEWRQAREQARTLVAKGKDTDPLRIAILAAADNYEFEMLDALLERWEKRSA